MHGEASAGRQGLDFGSRGTVGLDSGSYGTAGLGGVLRHSRVWGPRSHAISHRSGSRAISLAGSLVVK